MSAPVSSSGTLQGPSTTGTGSFPVSVRTFPREVWAESLAKADEGIANRHRFWHGLGFRWWLRLLLRSHCGHHRRVGFWRIRLWWIELGRIRIHRHWHRHGVVAAGSTAGVIGMGIGAVVAGTTGFVSAGITGFDSSGTIGLASGGFASPFSGVVAAGSFPSPLAISGSELPLVTKITKPIINASTSTPPPMPPAIMSGILLAGPDLPFPFLPLAGIGASAIAAASVLGAGAADATAGTAPEEAFGGALARPLV